MATRLLWLLQALLGGPWALLARGVGGVTRRAHERWERLLEPETQVRLSYVLYYWRARLRWPFRLLMLLGLLMLAWRYPWHAYAVVLLGLAALGVWITPHMPWPQQLGVTQPVSAGLAAGALFLCWCLPLTSAWLVGLSVWGLTTVYISWQLGLGGGALLATYYFFPSVVMALLGLAIWLFFLMALPRPCVLLTEYAALSYWGGAFLCLFVHVALLGGFFCFGNPILTVPLGAVLLCLWFFPRVVGGLFLLFTVWMISPALVAAKAYVLKAIEKPYGHGTVAPDKVRTAEDALRISTSGTDHYETLNSHRAAEPHELKACYKRMALMLHPDKNPSERAPVGFKRVQDAYDVLSDVLSRAEYDAEVDNGGPLGGTDGEGGADGGTGAPDVTNQAAAPPMHVPEGPPGLKKRRGKPTGGGRR